MTRTPLSRSKGQGHQAALLAAAFAHQAAAAVTVGTSSPWEPTATLLQSGAVGSAARDRRRPQRDERGGVILRWLPHSLFQVRSTEKKFRHPIGIYTILCWRSDAPPPSVLQMFEFLASSIVQASMSSSTRCDAVSVFLAEVQAGGTLRVNAFEFWDARWPSGLARLAKDLICATASQAYVGRIFPVCGLLYSGRRRALFRCLEMSVCLKLRQCWKRRPSYGNFLSETWC